VATTVLNPTFKDAQWLADHVAAEGMVVSCYADTSPAGVRPLWREHLKNEVKRIDAHTDTHRGRLCTAIPGAVHLIEEIEEPVPKRHRAAGELWGKQQGTIARHREDAGVVALLAREARWVTPAERVLTASLPEPRA
jgi:hypothetical protein